MQCPLCLDSPLEPKFVGATEVDICQKCRGIWLDRGELDHLLGDVTPVDDRSGGRDRDEAPRREDRPPTSTGKKPTGKKSKAKRLADLFEEVLDF